mmetsp:Transcript_14090/g.37115  ORF Transcript_14090/g.37115 Transcript_14090/m.37115 type:complete len:554 (-) Transcript_14090:76-1737(-)
MTLAPTIKRDLDVADVWVEVDLLNLADPSQMRTKKLHKSGVNLNYAFSKSLTIAAGSKEQDVLKQALSSQQEQDSDVYFIMKTQSARGVERELGQGFLNLQTVLKGGKDMEKQSVALQGKAGAAAGNLVVSLVALDALRAATGQAVPAAATQPVSTALRVDIGAMTLAPTIKRDLDVADVWVEVDLVGLTDPSQMKTKRLHKSSVNLNFGYAQSVPVDAGSREEEVLRQVMGSQQEQDSDVYFIVKTQSARGQEREIGQGFLNLQTVLKGGRDLVSQSVAVQGKVGSVGNLVVSLVALDALQAATGQAVPVARAPVATAARPTATAARPTATTARATVTSPAAASASPAGGRAGCATAIASAAPAAAVATGSGSPHAVRSVAVQRQPAAQGAPLPVADDTLILRVESLALAPSYQSDPGISRLFISLAVLGSTFNTPDLAKTSAPPIQVNAVFKVPFSRTEHSRTREELLRAMRHGDRSNADVKVSLCYYESGVGGEEGLELATGKINLRDIWAAKADLKARRVPLLEEQLNEQSSITISSSVIRALSALLQQ